jgi:hypothetical protein
MATQPISRLWPTCLLCLSLGCWAACENPQPSQSEREAISANLENSEEDVLLPLQRDRHLYLIECLDGTTPGQKRLKIPSEIFEVKRKDQVIFVYINRDASAQGELTMEGSFLDIFNRNNPITLKNFTNEPGLWYESLNVVEEADTILYDIVIGKPADCLGEIEPSVAVNPQMHVKQ